MRSGNHWLQKAKAEETQNDKIHVQSLLRQQEIPHKAPQDHQAQPAAWPTESPPSTTFLSATSPSPKYLQGWGLPTALGSPCQCLAALCVKKSFLRATPSLSQHEPACEDHQGATQKPGRGPVPQRAQQGDLIPPSVQQQHVVHFCSNRSVRTVIYSGKKSSLTRFISLPGSLISRSPHDQDVALSQG